MSKMKTTVHWHYEPRSYAMRASRELRAELLEKQMEDTIQQDEKKKLHRSYWWQRLAWAMADLRKLDPTGWETWFDSDAVPEYGTKKSRALLVEARCRHLAGSRPTVRATARLYRDVFIWRDANSFFIFGEDKRIYEFESEPEAQGHIDATLVMCRKLLGALA